MDIRNNILYIFLDEYPVVSQLLIIGEKSNRIKDEITKLISIKEKAHLLKII